MFHLHYYLWCFPNHLGLHEPVVSAQCMHGEEHCFKFLKSGLYRIYLFFYFRLPQRFPRFLFYLILLVLVYRSSMFVEKNLVGHYRAICDY